MSKSNEAKCLSLVEKTVIDVPVVGNIFKTKMLYKIGKKIQQWQGFVQIESGNIVDYLPNKTKPYGAKVDIKAYYYAHHGQKEKKITESEKTEVSKGLFIGKKNEISPIVVALNKIDTIYNNKIKSGYSETLDEITSLDFTKLYKQGKHRLFIEKFHDFNKQKKKLLGRELVVQRKLNGTTMIVVYHPIIDKPYNCDAFLRGRTDFHNYELIAKEITEGLHITPGLYLIGELYLHGAYLEDISGLARVEEISSDKNSGLEYYIFDCFDINNPKLTYGERCKVLHGLFLQATTSNSTLKFCKLVETFNVGNSDQVAQIELYFKQFLDEKYEGLIVRALDGVSMNSFNSTYKTYDIQKLKPFYDDEFKLVEFTDGKGKNKGVVKFICETMNGVKFSVQPNGDVESKKLLFQQLSENDNALWKSTYEGKLYKVKYAFLSKNLVPSQPVGLGLRTEETLS